MNEVIFENKDCRMTVEKTENGLDIFVSGKNFTNQCSHAKVKICIENGVIFTEQYKPSNADRYTRKDCLAVVDTESETIYHNTAKTSAENVPDWEKRFVLYAYDEDADLYEPITAYNDIDHAILRAKELAVNCTNPNTDWFEITCENNLTVMIITRDGQTIPKLRLLNRCDFPNIYNQMHFLVSDKHNECVINEKKLEYILHSINASSDTAKIITASRTEYMYLVEAIADAVPDKQTVIIENKADALDEAMIDTIIAEYKNALSDKTESYIVCFTENHATQNISEKFSSFINHLLSDSNCSVLLRNNEDETAEYSYEYDYIDFNKTLNPPIL